MTPLARFTKPRAKGLVLNRVSAELLSDGSFSGFYQTGSSTGERETIDTTFDGYVQSIYKSNGIVFACISARMMPFSEARFLMQEMDNGRPGKLFDHASLGLLENPWMNGTTGELLARMEQDASLAGNFYATTVGTGSSRRIRRLRPDWMTIISGVRNEPNGSPFELDAEVLAYIYQPPQHDPVLLTPARVVHYSPIPDPEAQWRGMSWLTPLVREIQADQYATKHKLKFFENGAALNTVISYDATVNPDQFQRYVQLFNEAHQGTDNAYKTLHIGGGADATVIGTELKTDFRAIQGAGETRIAAAAGVGAIIARFSEGLAGSSLNQGNYSAAKRQFADMTLRPLWRIAASSLSKLTTPPAGSRLSYDTRDVEFLKEDRKDASEIMQMTANTMNSLVTAGYTPDSVVVAVETGDLSKLVHSGRYSVQLHAATGDDELSLTAQVDSAGALVRAGFDPAAALGAVGLDPIRHLGLLPVTLQSTRQLELTPAEAQQVS